MTESCPMKSKAKLSHKALLVSIAFLFNLRLLASTVYALEVTSANYKIQGGYFNLETSPGQSTASSLPSEFIAKGYTAISGWQNKAAGEEFSISVSPQTLSYGTLMSGKPIEKSALLTVNTQGISGYKIYALVDHVLRSQAGIELKDILWQNNNSTGFGFRIEGNGVPYRPFPSAERKENPLVVMDAVNGKKSQSSLLKLIVNVGPDEENAKLQNTLYIFALPKI